MDVVVAPAVRKVLDRHGEAAVTVDVTLRFCGGLVTKDAVALPGQPPEGAGFAHVVQDGIDLFWRQRFDIEGHDPTVESRVVPKKVRLSTRGSEIVAEASY
jgi:hypothetical protein